MSMNDKMDYESDSAMNEGRGLCRVLVIAAILGIIAAVVFIAGCATYTPLTPEQIDATVAAVTNSNAYAEIVAQIRDRETQERVIEAIENEGIPLVIDSAEDAVPFSSLSFTYGGVKGSSCQLVKTARIKNLKADNSDMSYQWEVEGCEELGASSRTSYAGISACLFVKNSAGQWVGGRFDAISTSRLTRSFKNITGEQYRGWRRDEFYASKEVLFVIISDDCKWRTNVIRGSK